MTDIGYRPNIHILSQSEHIHPATYHMEKDTSVSILTTTNDNKTFLLKFKLMVSMFYSN